jgi:peptidyl-prolyl cis-trans isomerase SurA
MKKAQGVLIGIGLILLLGVGNPQAEVANRIVAIVNNDIITHWELEKTVKAAGPQASMRNDPEIQKKILFQLVDQKIVDHQIKRLGISISKEEVEMSLQRIRKEQRLEQPEDFAAALAREGLTEEELRNRIREQIQRFRLVNREVGSKIVISESQVKAYYQNNREKFQQTDAVHLAVISLPLSSNNGPEEALKQKEKAEMILARLKKGEPFRELARAYSEDPSASTGGDLGLIPLKDLSPSLREIVAILKPGEFSPVLENPEALQLVQVIDFQKGKDFSFEEVRDRIHEQLFQEEVDKRFIQYLQRLRERSHIQILL